MKHLLTLLSLLLTLLTPLSALSVTGGDVVQPFDSRMELKKIDFHETPDESLREWAEKTTVSVVVMGPVLPLYGWFGHSAIMVRQPGGHAIMYDYGIFDNTGADFYFNFMRGRMLYSVWATDGDWRIDSEKETGRSITEYVLTLTPEQKVAIFKFLQENVKQENNTYLYHFYKDNCATRLRDILDEATDGDFKAWTEKDGTLGSYRSWADTALTHSPCISFVLNTLEGPEIDHAITAYERMYLPEHLGELLMDYPAFKTEKRIVQEQQAIIPFTPKTFPVNDHLTFLFFGVAFAVIILLTGRLKHKGFQKTLECLFLFVLGFLGLLLVWGMCFSNIDVIWYNELIVLINPLLFLPCFWVWKHPERTQKYKRVLTTVTVILLTLKGLFPEVFIQDDLRTIYVLLPYLLTGFIKDDSRTLDAGLSTVKS